MNTKSLNPSFRQAQEAHRYQVLRPSLLGLSLLTALASAPAVATSPAIEAVDIDKVNKVFADIKDKVLPDYANIVESANLIIDPATFDLEALRFDTAFDATVVRSLWAPDQKTTTEIAFGTALIEEQDVDFVTGTLNLGLRTQVLKMLQYGARKMVGEEAPPPEERDDRDILLVDYFDSIIRAESLATVYAKTLELRAAILESPIEDPARTFFEEVRFSESDVGYVLEARPFQFYGVDFQVTVALDEESIDLVAALRDTEGTATRELEEYKDELHNTLVEIQNGLLNQDIEDGLRGFLEMAGDWVGATQTKVEEGASQIVDEVLRRASFID